MFEDRIAKTGLLLLALAAGPHAGLSAPGGRYSVSTPGDLGMAQFVALNNSGQVLGTTSDASRVLFFDGTTTKDYGTGSADIANPILLNDAGQIVGNYLWLSSPNTQPFLCNDGQFSGLAPPSAYRSSPTGLNGLGDVIWSEPASGSGAILGILFHDGVETPLGDLGSAGVYPLAINRSDQITGDALVNSPGGADAFLWQNGAIRDLGWSGAGTAINDSGLIGGALDEYSGGTSSRRLVLFSVNTPIDLGRLGEFDESLYNVSHVNGINDLGIVVGNSANRPFLWSGGKMIDLRDIVDTTGTGIDVQYLDQPIAINDRGQILARDYLLTPLPISGPESRLANISIRSEVGSGEGTCITGFVVAGGARTVLVRVIGPSLAQFGVTGFAVDPSLTLFSMGTAIATNDDWGVGGDQATLVAAMQSVGAFPLDPSSKDAALLTTVSPGPYSIVPANRGDSSGIVLSEIYDTGSGGEGQLINCSARVQVGTGNSVGILGFVVSGDNPLTLLLRAVGPGLNSFGVSDTLGEPVLWLHNELGPVMGNQGWGSKANQPLLANVMAQVGAFTLQDGSRDSAMLVRLEAGAYTMTVAGADGGQGVALLELYVVPDAAIDSSIANIQALSKR